MEVLLCGGGICSVAEVLLCGGGVAPAQTSGESTSEAKHVVQLRWTAIDGSPYKIRRQHLLILKAEGSRCRNYRTVMVLKDENKTRQTDV